jgi:Ca2+-binding RTX toxin-like protein
MATVEDIFLQELLRVFNNTGGRNPDGSTGIQYGGTGQTGTITGNATGGSGTGTSYTSGGSTTTGATTGPAEVGPNGSQVLYGVANFDENGNKIYIDIQIYGPRFTVNNYSAYDRFMHNLSDIGHELHSILSGGNQQYWHDTRYHLRSLDELFQTGGNVGAGDSASAPKMTASFGSDEGELMTGSNVLHGGAGNDTIIAGAGDDAIFGGIGDDALLGNAGQDLLHGGAGNDWLDGGPGGDVLDGGSGWDVLSYQSATSGVTVNLTSNQNGGTATGDAISNIEVVQGTNFADTLTGVDRGGGNGVQLYGEGGNDSLTGMGGGDYLVGGSGNDTLDGGACSDLLNGGAGADTFRFSTALGAGNVDTLQDFSVAEGDRIVLSRSVFASAGYDYLSGAAFKLGAAATAAEHRIVYNQSTGELFYDADGAGAAAAIKFALIANHAQLSAASFQIL